MNNTYPHPIIARRGWSYLGGIFIVTLIVQAVTGFGWARPFWALTLSVLQFSRNPVRVMPTQANTTFSPADGHIVAIEQVRDPHADRDAPKISVFMNVFNMYSNRAPVGGTVQQVQCFPDKSVDADLDKALLENERNAIVLRYADGQLVTSVQVTGSIARCILYYTKAGEALTRDQRYSFIRFGLCVDVYLPLTACPCMIIGEKASAMFMVLVELN